MKNDLVEWYRHRAVPGVLLRMVPLLAGAVLSCSENAPSNLPSGSSGGGAAAAGGGMNPGGAGAAANPVVAGAGGAGGTGAGGVGGVGGSAAAGRGGQPGDEYTENPGPEGNGDFEIGPDYTRDPDLTDQGNPKGKSFSFTMPLAESKIFDGTDETLRSPARQERGITVYVPAAYVDGKGRTVHDCAGR